MNLFDQAAGRTPLRKDSGSIGKRPNFYKQDSETARRLALEQRLLGRLAVWCDIWGDWDGSYRAIAAVIPFDELGTFVDLGGRDPESFRSGLTSELTPTQLAVHPTASTEERDLWALRAAIEKVEALAAETASEE